MEKDPANVVTDSYRESTLQNLDNLGNRRRSIEESMRVMEEEHRAALAEALSPLEAQLRDCNAAIYATERMLGALPAQAPRFQERDGSADTGSSSAESPETEDVGRGLSESQAAG